MLKNKVILAFCPLMIHYQCFNEYPFHLFLLHMCIFSVSVLNWDHRLYAVVLSVYSSVYCDVHFLVSVMIVKYSFCQSLQLTLIVYQQVSPPLLPIYVCCCLVTKLCLPLCNSMYCSPRLPLGILQARILEWVAISSYRGSS